MRWVAVAGSLAASSADAIMGVRIGAVIDPPAPTPIMLDDIAAIITPSGSGAVSGIRVSGPGALAVGAAVFPALGTSPTPRHAYAGTFVHGDTGILIPYVAPSSYTGENAVECFVHGSPASVALLLEKCIEAGARPAAPGEFTLRAFLNGKIDLTEAEAVADLIDSQSRQTFEAAAAQLQGSLRREAEAVAAGLSTALAAVEAWVDFSEEIGELDPGSLEAPITDAKARLESMAHWAALAPEARSGTKVVILGPPNSGKSTLFNALMREERAIVTDVPGTTRDLLFGSMSLSGVGIELIDTAGIRDSDDPIEAIGIGKALDQAKSAAAVIIVTDLTAVSSERWRPKEPLAATILQVATKADAALVIPGSEMPNSDKPDSDKPDSDKPDPAISGSAITDSAITGPAKRELPNPALDRFDAVVSARTGQGMNDLVDGLRRLLGERTQPLPFLANERQSALLHRAAQSVAAAGAAIENRLPIDLISTCLRDALAAVHELLGVAASPEALDEIFSRFCIGK